MAPALEVADIFRRHGEAFRQAHAGHLGGVERRIMGAITACRTAVLGGHVEQCDDCGAIRIAYNSCRNRHCPKCQGLARAQWLADRQAELLPVPYFHVVFTLPAPVGEGEVHLGAPAAGDLDLRAVREVAERQAVLAALARTDRNIVKTAELLGVSRPTLYDLMHRLAIR